MSRRRENIAFIVNCEVMLKRWKEYLRVENWKACSLTCVRNLSAFSSAHVLKKLSFDFRLLRVSLYSQIARFLDLWKSLNKWYALLMPNSVVLIAITSQASLQQWATVSHLHYSTTTKRKVYVYFSSRESAWNISLHLDLTVCKAESVEQKDVWFLSLPSPYKWCLCASCAWLSLPSQPCKSLPPLSSFSALYIQIYGAQMVCGERRACWCVTSEYWHKIWLKTYINRYLKMYRTLG